MKHLTEHLKTKWLTNCGDNFIIALFPDERSWLVNIAVETPMENNELSENLMVSDLFSAYNFPDSGVLYLFYEITPKKTEARVTRKTTELKKFNSLQKIKGKNRDFSPKNNDFCKKNINFNQKSKDFGLEDRFPQSFKGKLINNHERQNLDEFETQTALKCRKTSEKLPFQGIHTDQNSHFKKIEKIVDLIGLNFDASSPTKFKTRPNTIIIPKK